MHRATGFPFTSRPPLDSDANARDVLSSAAAVKGQIFRWRLDAANDRTWMLELRKVLYTCTLGRTRTLLATRAAAQARPMLIETRIRTRSSSHSLQCCHCVSGQTHALNQCPKSLSC